MTLQSLSPFIRRVEARHGQGTLTYDQSNALQTEQVFPQAAPDPIRQGDTPARPARMPVAAMSLNTNTFGYAIPDDFAPSGMHLLSTRLVKAGRQVDVKAMNRVGVRPNIQRPPAVAYGSLFELPSSIYDITGAQ